MREIKKEKGITLIALIITIVVLLILAVVAIGAAQESNIVGYAQNAATKYEQAQDNEIGLMSTYENILEKYENPETSEWKAYGTTQQYILINNVTNKVYSVQDGTVSLTMDLRTDKTLEEYLVVQSDYTYNIDSRIKDLSTVIVYNNTNPVGVIDSNNNYVQWSVFQDHSNKINTITVDKTISVNNQIDYSSILSQIQ